MSNELMVIGCSLIGVLFVGGIPALIYFLLKRLSKQEVDKKSIFNLFKYVFYFFFTVMSLTSAFGSSTKEEDKGICFLVFCVFWLVVGIIKANKDKKFKSNVKELNLIYPLGGRGERLIGVNLHGDNILIKLKGAFGEGLVITDKRIYVLKWGFMAGNFFGGQCIAFEYRNIVGLDIRTGFSTGTVQIMTPSNQETQGKTYWGTGRKDATRAENMVSFYSRDFAIFQEAVKIGRDRIQNSTVQVIQTAQSVPSTSNFLDLEKLAELKGKGIITQEEFDAKKKKILDL